MKAERPDQASTKRDRMGLKPPDRARILGVSEGFSTHISNSRSAHVHLVGEGLAAAEHVARCHLQAVPRGRHL